MPQSQQARLPDGIDPDEAVRQLDLPPDPRLGSRYRKAMIRKAYTFIRNQETATSSDIISGVWPNSQYKDHAEVNSRQWYATQCSPFLARLPGIVDESGSWRFDPSTDERPPVPEEPTYLPDEDARTALRDHGYGGDSQRTAKNYCAVRDAYFHIREHGVATRDQLKEFASLSTKSDPDRGLYQSETEFYGALMRPVLEDMPDIDAPVMPGGEWRYIGIEPDSE